ncbi:MAG: hypothetical protein AAF222_10510 [Pseudomonadota bacterium]
MIEPHTYLLSPSQATDHLSPPLFSMKGIHAGPRLVVSAPEQTARILAERLWDLPSLGHMHGSLVVRSDRQDPAFDSPGAVLSLSELSEKDAYYQTLGRMTALGMISGRGVPLRLVA